MLFISPKLCYFYYLIIQELQWKIGKASVQNGYLLQKFSCCVIPSAGDAVYCNKSFLTKHWSRIYPSRCAWSLPHPFATKHFFVRCANVSYNIFVRRKDRSLFGGCFQRFANSTNGGFARAWRTETRRAKPRPAAHVLVNSVFVKAMVKKMARFGC